MAPEMPTGDVEVGRDDLAGLADLPVVRRVAGVDGGAGGADGGAELVGDRQDDLQELLRRAERAAARDDDLGRGQFRPVGRRDSLSSTKVDRPGSAAALDVLDRRAEPPSAAAWKEAVRTVMTFLASVDFTVWMALPA